MTGPQAAHEDKTHVFLFANRDLGAPICRATVRHARRRRIPLTIVRSRHYQSWRGLLKNELPERVIAAVRYVVSAGRVHTWFCRDVNEDSFRTRVGPAAHGVVSGFNQIFDERTIDCFATLINVHPSILPWYRGPTPAYWCLHNGEQRSGITLHTMTPRIDDGPILHQEVITIEGLTSPRSITGALGDLAAPHVLRWIDAVIGDHRWQGTMVDPAEVYVAEVGYRGFPDSV